MIRVQAVGEIARYRVQGETGVYFVDLLSYEGNGKCDCPHFRCRLEKRVSEREGTLRCKHILAAREHLLEYVIQKLALSHKHPANERQ